MRKNKKINKPEKIYIKKISKKAGFIRAFILLLLLALVIRIGYIQFVKGAEYKEAAYNIQTINKIISPKRGTIYDATGKALAISADVDTITINPKSLKYKDGTKVDSEFLTNKFVTLFGLDHDTVYKKVTSDSSVETIVKKIEEDKVNDLKNWITDNKIVAGINIDPDTKRYYPYNNLASQLIGVCGDENRGLAGLEYQWNSVLLGTPGRIVTSSNVMRQEIPDQKQTYIAAENGSNLVLTVDANIQSIAEKYLKQAVEENNCSRGGNVVIMNPNNGDILAMATYPDFNLNAPFEPNTDELKNIWDTLSSDEKSDKIYSMWSNRAISDGYEPGSTFKIVTTSIALEENLVSTDTPKDFLCSGYEMVDGEKIECWRSYNPHGYQSLRQALMNSCNPAFMQLGKRIGAKLFYKYLNAFGFLGTTGVQLPGEASGIFHDESTIKPIELATMSFGQRFTISPLQMATAACAIANDGVLVQPRIVKQVINSDTGAITNIDPIEKRQVISTETSEKMRNLMESVTVEGTGGYAKVNGYSIGGKTGTSEPAPGKEEDGYTASYVAISPTLNTQVVILVTLYDPSGAKGHQGGQVAGPVVSQILSEVLPYMGIASSTDGSSSSITSSNAKTLVDLRNKTVTEAKNILKNLKFDVNVNVSGNENEVIVKDQMPKPGYSLEEGAMIFLYTAENNAGVDTTVPNLKGMSLAQAKNSLKSKNLNITYEGTGKVISQSISTDQSVPLGTIVHVTLQPELQDTH